MGLKKRKQTPGRQNKINKQINTYIYIYMYVVLNNSSQETPFRKSFACFRGPIRVTFSKIENSHQESNIWNQTNSVTNYTIINKYVVVYTNECGSNQHVIVICCFFSLGAMLSFFSRRQIAAQILGRTWLEWIRLSRIFRAPFANLSL